MNIFNFFDSLITPCNHLKHTHKHSIVSKYVSPKMDNNLIRLYMDRVGGSVYDETGVRCEICGMYFPKGEIHTDTDHKHVCHLCFLRYSQMQCEICGKFMVGDSLARTDAFVIPAKRGEKTIGHVVCIDCLMNYRSETQSSFYLNPYDVIRVADSINSSIPKEYIAETVQKYKLFKDKMNQELDIFEDKLMNENEYHVGLTDSFDKKKAASFNNGKNQVIPHPTAKKMVFSGIENSVEEFFYRLESLLDLTDEDLTKSVSECTASGNSIDVLIIVPAKAGIDKSKIEDLFKRTVINRRFKIPYPNLEWAAKVKGNIQKYTPKVEMPALDVSIDDGTMTITAEIVYSYDEIQ